MKRPARAIASFLWLGVSMLGLTVYASRSTPFVRLTESLVSGSTTNLPARIEPGFQADLLSEFAAAVVSVHAKPGDVVQGGATLMVLESEDLAHQVESARARLAAALAHLDAIRRTDSRAASASLRGEQKRAAKRSRDMAEERLKVFRLSDVEAILQAARKRTQELRTLVQDGFATGQELESQILRQDAAARDVEAAKEHLSRLQQEFEQADSYLRQVELQTNPDAPDTSAAEADIADARTALLLAEERVRRLTVVAPREGTILESALKPGEFVGPGTRLIRLADLTELAISAPVAAALANRISIGQPVAIVLPGHKEKIRARVSELTLVPDPARQAYLVRALILNPSARAILAGLEAQMEFEHLDRP